MKECEACKIKFNTNEKYCPICHNPLKGECNDTVFPLNTKYKESSMLLKILLFLSITILLIFNFLELYETKSIHYSLYIGLGLITNYITVLHIVKNYQNLYKMMGKYGTIVVALLLVWYFLTKRPVITNYVIPIVCILELVFNFLIGVVIKDRYIFKYSGQLLMNLFLLLVPVILVLFKLTTKNFLSYICCLLCIISIIGLLIFFLQEIKEELSKIFNI